ncbi:unnamed protein product [Malus baccata var. baccata]
MDKSWLTIPRNLEAYIARINLFLDQAVANGVGPDKFRCPYKRCCNRYTFVRNTVVEHLILYDMDKDYKNAWWRHHEEGVAPSTGPPIGERRPEEVETFFRLLEEADQDLWPGCKEFKKLEAVVRLYQVKCLAGMQDEIFITLLELIKRMLPKGDCLHDSCYNAKKLINDLGLTYVKIDACPNDCMIYWKDTLELTVCSVVVNQDIKLPTQKIAQEKRSQLRLCGPHSPGKEIDVYMPPLIDELNELWELCSKKEFEEGFKQLNSRIALTLCQLEKIFPPAFFDIMVHLPVHLADEAALVEPVQYRWMYPIEWYLQTLNRYVHNKGRPKGFIVEAYLVDECLSFCSMYLRDVESRRTRKGRNEDGIGRGVYGGLSIFDSKGCYMGSGENVELDLNVLDQCHRYILNNCDEVHRFRRQHEEFLNMKHRRERLTMRQIQELSKKEFPEWFKQHMNSRCHPNDTLISQDLRWLANYPSKVVSRYKSHIVHVFRFRIKSEDDEHKNQNCGIFVPANVLGAIGQVNCYGRVVDMFEVKYCGHAEPGDKGPVKCEWVNSESPRGMKTDQYGFTMVNFSRLGFKKNPFILALQAFYVEDTIEKDWHVVVRTQSRDLFDILEDSDAIEDYGIPNLDDQILDHENFHIRVGVEETYFHESLPLPTQFASNDNADDDTTDEDME